LALTPVQRRDAYRVGQSVTDEIARWIGLTDAHTMRKGTPTWAAESVELARRREAFRYLVHRDGRFAGTIEIRACAARGHVGYWLRRIERGKGTATMANWLVLLIGFEGMRLRSIDYVADAENGASVAVMERAGARRVAPYPVNGPGQRHMEVRYRLTRRRFRPPADAPASLAELAEQPAARLV
jgi:ribosomal-protein-alanine N-acetyltransferase